MVELALSILEEPFVFLHYRTAGLDCFGGVMTGFYAWLCFCLFVFRVYRLEQPIDMVVAYAQALVRSGTSIYDFPYGVSWAEDWIF